jgi:hypothetical protein
MRYFLFTFFFMGIAYLGHTQIKLDSNKYVNIYSCTDHKIVRLNLDTSYKIEVWFSGFFTTDTIAFREYGYSVFSDTVTTYRDQWNNYISKRYLYITARKKKRLKEIICSIRGKIIHVPFEYGYKVLMVTLFPKIINGKNVIEYGFQYSNDFSFLGVQR